MKGHVEKEIEHSKAKALQTINSKINDVRNDIANKIKADEKKSAIYF